MDTLHTIEDELIPGRIIDRPNRFVVRVRFDEAPARVFLGDPSSLEGIIEPGNEILCSPATDPERATDYDAIAVRFDSIYVSVRAALANDLFARALQHGSLPAFDGYKIQNREPSLPDHGRADFQLASPTGDDVFVEVKSCTFMEDGMGKFPDRPTERGRRHLRSLESLISSGIESHLVFVAQRPDIDAIRPYHEVDPAFTELLGQVEEAGVGVHALSITFDPPEYRLENPSLPVRIE